MGVKTLLTRVCLSKESNLILCQPDAVGGCRNLAFSQQTRSFSTRRRYVWRGDISRHTKEPVLYRFFPSLYLVFEYFTGTVIEVRGAIRIVSSHYDYVTTRFASLGRSLVSPIWFRKLWLDQLCRSTNRTLRRSTHILYTEHWCNTHVHVLLWRSWHVLYIMHCYDVAKNFSYIILCCYVAQVLYILSPFGLVLMFLYIRRS